MFLAQDIDDDSNLFSNQVFEIVAGKPMGVSCADADSEVGAIDLSHIYWNEPNEEKIDENFVIKEHVQLSIHSDSTLSKLSSERYESIELFEEDEKCRDKVNINFSKEFKECGAFEENREDNLEFLNLLSTKSLTNRDQGYIIRENLSEFNCNNSKEASSKVNEGEHIIKLKTKKNDQKFKQKAKKSQDDKSKIKKLHSSLNKSKNSEDTTKLNSLELADKDKGENLHKIIIEGLNPQVHIERQNISCRSRGRPEKKIDTRIENLLKIFNSKWIKKFVGKSGKKQRSDAKFASIARYFKKIPLIFLEHFGSKCKYKSSDIFDVIGEYLKIYTLCFQPLYEINQEALDKYEVDRVSMFLYFMLLDFPETRCCEVLSILKNAKNDKIMDSQTYERMMDLLEKRKSASK